MRVRRYRTTVPSDDQGEPDNTRAHIDATEFGDRSLVDSNAGESEDPVESMTVFLHLFTSVSSFGL
jgi:hypothetical protein